MRALVTGGAGFIGSNLVDALIDRGDEVVVLDDLSSGKRENLEHAFAAGTELVEGSITDEATVAEAFERARPDAVFHFAAQIDVRRSVTEPLYDLDLNVAGTINLLERAREDNVPRFVFASTGGAIYGEGEGRELPFTETAECAPEAPYAQSKLSAEGYVGLYRRLHGLETTVLRLANVYGPRQDPRLEAGVVAIFCGELSGGRRPTVFGDGEQTRDYVYVGDVAAAFATAADGAGPGPFNIGTGSETSVLDLGRAIAAAAGTEFDPEFAELRAGEVRRSSIDPGLAGRDFGWRPQISLAEGIGLTLASVAGG
jgi:UDP-glucose 4-epimerase